MARFSNGEKTFGVELSSRKIKDGIEGYYVYIRVYDPKANPKKKEIRVKDVFLRNRTDWDKMSKRVNPAIPNSIELTKCILDALERVKREEGSLFSYLDYVMDRMQATNSIAYMKRFQKLYNKLSDFLRQTKKGIITLSEVNNKFLDDFWLYLSQQNTSKNSEKTLSRSAIVDYFKVLNTILNIAKERGELKENPFDSKRSKTYTREPKERVVAKEPLTQEEQLTIQTLELHGMEDVIRDLFLFSFFVRGMRFEDVISITWDCIKDGRLTYKMLKNGKIVSISITPVLERILQKYESNESRYIFPLLKNDYGSQFDLRSLPNKKAIEFEKEKKRINSIVNKYLKKIAAKAGITKKLTFHIGRHTVGNLFYEDYGEEDTQDLLCHSNANTTRRYVDKGEKEKELEQKIEAFYKKFDTENQSDERDCCYESSEEERSSNGCLVITMNPDIGKVKPSRL